MSIFDKLDRVREKAHRLSLTEDQRKQDRTEEAIARIDAGRQTLTAILEGNVDAARNKAAELAGGRSEAVGKLTQVMAQVGPQLQGDPGHLREVISQLDAARSQLQGAQGNVEKVANQVETSMGRLLDNAKIPATILPRNLVGDLVEDERASDPAPPTQASNDPAPAPPGGKQPPVPRAARPPGPPNRAADNKTSIRDLAKKSGWLGSFSAANQQLAAATRGAAPNISFGKDGLSVDAKLGAGTAGITLNNEGLTGHGSVSAEVGGVTATVGAEIGANNVTPTASVEGKVGPAEISIGLDGADIQIDPLSELAPQVFGDTGKSVIAAGLHVERDASGKLEVSANLPGVSAIVNELFGDGAATIVHKPATAPTVVPPPPPAQGRPAGATPAAKKRAHDDAAPAVNTTVKEGSTTAAALDALAAPTNLLRKQPSAELGRGGPSLANLALQRTTPGVVLRHARTMLDIGPDEETPLAAPVLPTLEPTKAQPYGVDIPGVNLPQKRPGLQRKKPTVRHPTGDRTKGLRDAAATSGQEMSTKRTAGEQDAAGTGSAAKQSMQSSMDGDAKHANQLTTRAQQPVQLKHHTAKSPTPEKPAKGATPTAASTPKTGTAATTKGPGGATPKVASSGQSNAALPKVAASGQPTGAQPALAKSGQQPTGAQPTLAKTGQQPTGEQRLPQPSGAPQPTGAQSDVAQPALPQIGGIVQDAINQVLPLTKNTAVQRQVAQLATAWNANLGQPPPGWNPTFAKQPGAQRRAGDAALGRVFDQVKRINDVAGTSPQPLLQQAVATVREGAAPITTPNGVGATVQPSDGTAPRPADPGAPVLGSRYTSAVAADTQRLAQIQQRAEQKLDQVPAPAPVPSATASTTPIAPPQRPVAPQQAVDPQATAADANHQAQQVANQHEQRGAKAAHHQQQRKTEGAKRGGDAKASAAKQKQQQEAARHAAAEKQKKQMIDGLNAHSELALKALTMNQDQLRQEYATRLKTDLDAIKADLVTTKAAVTDSWNKQKPVVEQAHKDAVRDIEKMCTDEVGIAKSNIAKLKVQITSDPPKAAKTALEMGTQDCNRYDTTCTANKKKITDNAEEMAKQQEKMGAEAKRVKEAKAARTEDEAAKKEALAQAADVWKQFSDRAAKERADGVKKAGEEQKKFDDLKQKRTESAKKTHDEILANGKEYAKKLDEQLKVMLADIEKLRVDGKQLADDRCKNDLEHIAKEIEEEFKRLDAELEDQRIRAEEEAKYSVASLQSMTEEQKAKAKADIEKARDASVKRITDAKDDDVAMLQFELADCHEQIDKGIAALGSHTVKAVSQISQFKQDFDQRIEGVKNKIEAKAAAAENAQHSTAAAVQSGLATTRNRAYGNTTESAFKELDAEKDAFAKQKEAEAKADSDRRKGMLGLRNVDRDKKNSENKVKDAHKEIAEAIGYGINPDKGAVLKAISNLSPEELKALLNDPTFGAEIRNVITMGMGTGDMARIDAMSNSGTPEQLKAGVMMWAFKGGTGIGYDDKLFKGMVESMSPEERAEIDREFKRLKGDNPKGMSVNEMIDDEAWFSGSNNKMMKAYWKSQGAAIAEEKYQAANGGWLTDISDFTKEHPYLAAGITVMTGGAAAGVLYNPGLEQVKGFGTNQDAYVAQTDKIRDLTEPPPGASQDEIDRCALKRKQLMREIDGQLGSAHDGLTNEKMDNQEADDPYNKLWAKDKDNATFRTMLAASREGDWQNYSNNKAAYAAETTLGNRNWLKTEVERRRERGEIDGLKDFLSKREGAGGTFEGFIDANIPQKVDRGFFKSAAEPAAAPGTEKWREQMANRLLYAQFGGRTGWGDDRAQMEKDIANLPADQKKLLMAQYEKLSGDYGLTTNPDSEIVKNLGPLKYLSGNYWFGNYSTGNLEEDLKLSYGGQLSDLTYGVIGKGRSYTQIEYDLKNGKAETPEAQMRRAEHMRVFDTQSGLLGTAGMGLSGRIAEARYKDLQTSFAALQAAGLADKPFESLKPEDMTPAQQMAYADYAVAQAQSESAAVSANNVQKGIVDGVITVVTTAVTIIATVAITILTAGTATPFIVAALAAAAVAASAGLAAMGAKIILLGDKYSGNEAKMDFAAVVIDSIVAGVTAGEGINVFAKNMISKLGISSKLAGTLLKELIVNTIQAGGDLTKFLLDENLYTGSPEEVMAKLRAKTLKLGATAVISAGLGSSKLDHPMIQAAVSSAIEYDPSQPPMGQFLNFVNACVLAKGTEWAQGKGKGISEKHWGEGGYFDPSKPKKATTTNEPNSKHGTGNTVPLKEPAPANNGMRRRSDGTIEVNSPDIARSLEAESKQPGGKVKKIEGGEGGTRYHVEGEGGTVEVVVAEPVAKPKKAKPAEELVADPDTVPVDVEGKTPAPVAKKPVQDTETAPIVETTPPKRRADAELDAIKKAIEEARTPRVMKPITEWERVLSAIDRIDPKGTEGLRTKRAVGSGKVVSEGSSGAALDLARGAREDILAAKRVLKRIDAREGKYANLTPDQAAHLKALIESRVERKARAAVEAATGASGADLDAPNEVRKKLLEQYVDPKEAKRSGTGDEPAVEDGPLKPPKKPDEPSGDGDGAGKPPKKPDEPSGEEGGPNQPPKKPVDPDKTWSEDGRQLKKPDRESVADGQARRSEPLKPMEGSDEAWAKPADRKGVPDVVPLTRQEVRDVITAKYGATMEKFLSNKAHTADEAYKPLLDRMAKEEPGFAKKSPEGAQRLKDYMAELDTISKKIVAEKKGGVDDEAELRMLYNVVEQDFMKQKWLPEIGHLPVEQQAKLAHMWREEWKIYVRDMMGDNHAKEILYLRDRGLSGDRRGGRFEDFFAKNLKANPGDPDAAHQATIKSAFTSNEDVNLKKTGYKDGIDAVAAKQMRDLAEQRDTQQELTKVKSANADAVKVEEAKRIKRTPPEPDLEATAPGAKQQESSASRRSEIHLGEDTPATPPSPQAQGLRGELDVLHALRGKLRKAKPEEIDALKAEIAKRQRDLDGKLTDPKLKDALLDPHVVFALARERANDDASGGLKSFLSSNLDGVTKAQAQSRQGADPVLRAKREVFERELALSILNGPLKKDVDANLQAMCDKALDYINKSRPESERDAAIAGLGVGAEGGYAGAVLGSDPTKHAQTMRDVLAEGNARERMIALGKFTEMVAKDLANDPSKFDAAANKSKDSTKPSEFTAADAAAFQKRMKQFLEDKGIAPPKPGEPAAPVPDKVLGDFLKPVSTEISGAQKDYQTAKKQDMDTKMPGVFVDDAEAFLGAHLTEAQQKKAASGVTPGGEASPVARTTMTIEEADAMGYNLSKRERAAAEANGGKLPWIVGTTANIVDPSAKFIATATEASLPQKAGISGTTFRFMEASSLLGGDPNMSRLAMVGALQTIDAHTIYEIASAAQGFGLPFDPKQPYANLGIDPKILNDIAGRSGASLDELNGATPASTTTPPANTPTPPPPSP